MTYPPTSPIPLAGGAAAATARLDTRHVPVPESVAARLANACEVTTEPAELAESSRDWWPLAMTWATEGHVGALAAVVARPHTADGVAEVLRICNESRVPVTAAGGRSGVCGASVPVHGGVVVDLTRLSGIRSVDDISLVVDVAAGTFGDEYEGTLRRDHDLTGGHWPQSIALSTVGGWLACRGAGQYSTRYGKIEDLVVGLDVVLADGTQLHTGGSPRAAVGPDLTQLFVGSEGTLGIITGARLRVHRLHEGRLRRAYGFDSFADGLDACRRIVQRGATPAVVRLYDGTETRRDFDVDAGALLLVLDEADPAVIAATAVIVDDECDGADRLDVALVGRWLERRNHVDALESLISAGHVVDTIEVSGPWSALDDIHTATVAALESVEGTMAASCHQSHSYPDGACLYFTFGGHRDTIGDDRDRYYRRAWDDATVAALGAGASLSHHHGIGLNRAAHVAAALGSGHDVLVATKAAIDPVGILNPGKLGLPDPWATP